MLLKRLQPVPECFTRLTGRVTVFSRTAILAPGGWASDREPAKRVCGRSQCSWDGPAARKTLPSRNETSSPFACSASGWLDLQGFSATDDQKGTSCLSCEKSKSLGLSRFVSAPSSPL